LKTGADDEVDVVFGMADHASSKKHEAGMKTQQLAREHGLVETMPQNLKAKFGSMKAADT
jgi:hypothetical protein